ncbi:tRNA pseudouridine synthase B [subsurface metagenome]
MNGILNINKPEGRTSFSIVAMVKRLSGERRVGQGTRVVEFLVEASKVYRAQIELGVATDTYDASGKITQQGDPSGISQGQLESALGSFRGLIQQTPPMYSAVKYHGKRLYKLARAGIRVERKSRPVKIHTLELLDWQPPVATVEVVCGKGTYIRALAHDLGQALGCGANLKSLIRLRCGFFDIKDAISVSQLEDAFHHGYWQHLVYPIDTVLLHYSAIVVSDATGRTIRNGGHLVLNHGDSSYRTDFREQHSLVSPYFKNRCRVYTGGGCFLGVLYFNPETGQWQPEKILL